MSSSLTDKRRAVFTGLKPFMPREELMEALHHWEVHYADRPRFTLQRFVADICQDDPLRARRSDILLSLVQAMNMPASALLPDPLNGQPLRRMPSTPTEGNARSARAAFCALMDTLIKSVPLQHRHNVRLDLLASIDSRQWPRELVSSLQAWLGHDSRPLEVPEVAEELLQALVNRTYVVLAERLGPVEADHLLAAALRQTRLVNPALDETLTRLL